MTPTYRTLFFFGTDKDFVGWLNLKVEDGLNVVSHTFNDLGEGEYEFHVIFAEWN